MRSIAAQERAKRELIDPSHEVENVLEGNCSVCGADVQTFAITHICFGRKIRSIFDSVEYLIKIHEQKIRNIESYKDKWPETYCADTEISQHTSFVSELKETLDKWSDKCDEEFCVVCGNKMQLISEHKNLKLFNCAFCFSSCEVHNCEVEDNR